MDTKPSIIDKSKFINSILSPLYECLIEKSTKETAYLRKNSGMEEKVWSRNAECENVECRNAECWNAECRNTDSLIYEKILSHEENHCWIYL